jgi:hypothetical protein
VEADPPINILVDWRSLRAAGIGPQAPVTVRMTRPTTRDLLEVVLSQVGSSRGAAGYAVEGNVLVISDPASRALPVTVDVPETLDRRIPDLSFTGNAFADVMDFFGDIGDVRTERGRVALFILVAAVVFEQAGVECDVADQPGRCILRKYEFATWTGPCRRGACECLVLVHRDSAETQQFTFAHGTSSRAASRRVLPQNAKGS